MVMPREYPTQVRASVWNLLVLRIDRILSTHILKLMIKLIRGIKYFFIMFFLFSCIRKKNESYSKKLQGKWIHHGCSENTAMEIWTKNNKLLWFSKWDNHIYNKEFIIRNDSIIFSDSSLTGTVDFPYPGKIIFPSDQYFWISCTPSEVLVFKKVTSMVDSLNFNNPRLEVFQNEIDSSYSDPDW